jgi:hypothetical protein
MGLILAILGFLFLYAGFDSFGPNLILTLVLVVAGSMLSGAGLNLYFRPETTTLSRVRRALQKPLW